MHVVIFVQELKVNKLPRLLTIKCLDCETKRILNSLFSLESSMNLREDKKAA